MAPSSKISLRIIAAEEQVSEALQFRYRIYQAAFPKYVERLTESYESDLYDRHSIHLGMYDDDSRKLIGYCRMILPPAFQNQFSKWMVKEHPLYLPYIERTCKSQKLTFMNYVSSSSVRKKINSFCISLEKKQIVYAEISRFIIDEEYRALPMSTFFISGMIAVCNALNISYTLFTCDHHHERFYQRFGLNYHHEIGAFKTGFCEKQMIFYGLELNISSEFKSPVAQLREQFEHEHQITFKKIYRLAA